MAPLTLIRPDDWHVHLRDGAVLADVVPATAAQFARAIVMPNLKPPVTTVDQAAAYRDRIAAAVPPGIDFTPLMTLYLTDRTPPAEIRLAKTSGVVFGVKYYPAGATTNSDSGVTAIEHVHPVLEAMQRERVPLLVHGEATGAVDVFDRERIFVDTTLSRIVRDFPALTIVVEHVTTREAVDFVAAMPAHVGATITAQHLLFNRNAIFEGGIRPHYYCLPVLKREAHRQALIAAATSGNPKFFLGTDSAPHAKHTKEHACGCAGCYTAPAALELYAEAFASFHGADFYGLPRNRETVTLVPQEWRMPSELSFGDDRVVPLKAGELIRWKLLPSSTEAGQAVAVRR